MLWILVKKQLAEVFKTYFYDAKKNRMRSKGAIAAWFVFFFVVMVGMLGGIFTGLSLSLCSGLTEVGMGWLYFLLMSEIAVLLGAFGSVFNTYATLYLSKDNDLLLSMPIPVRTIVTARLVNVYLMGTMYSSAVLIPALIVYWVTVGATAANVICGILLFFIVSLTVLFLSTLLGWAVAKISQKLKNRSFLTVLLALLFIGAYYFFYFKANDLIRDLIEHAAEYGEKIKGAAYGLYLFGRIGEGDWGAAAVCTVIAVLLTALVWCLLSRSFLSVAASGGSTEKVRYAERTVREKSAFGALLAKEFARFASSPNYMLNCGLGILFIPALGVLLLIKGREILDAVGTVLSARPGSVPVLLCTALLMLTAMIDTAAPSVSLEGKSLWIPQSLPVAPKTVLRAKASVEGILKAAPMLFAGICSAVVLTDPVPVRLLVCAAALAYSAFSALFDTVLGLKMPILNWTNEIAPIKQSGAVMISIFGSWAICVAFAGLYMLAGYKIGAALYLLAWTLLLAAASALLLKWLDTKGAEEFASL